MMDPGIVVPVAGMITGIVITLSIYSISAYMRYKLKVEQIRADAMVRVEELKAKASSLNEDK